MYVIDLLYHALSLPGWIIHRKRGSGGAGSNLLRQSNWNGFLLLVTTVGRANGYLILYSVGFLNSRSIFTWFWLLMGTILPVDRLEMHQRKLEMVPPLKATSRAFFSRWKLGFTCRHVKSHAAPHKDTLSTRCYIMRFTAKPSHWHILTRVVTFLRSLRHPNPRVNFRLCGGMNGIKGKRPLYTTTPPPTSLPIIRDFVRVQIGASC